MLWMGIWVHPYRRITCAGEGEFSGNGVWPSLYDVAVSWLRLQTPIDCIPHPYWMYTKCLSTLRCCGWEFGHALMPYYMCRWGWILGKMGNGRDCMMLQCHGWGCKSPKDCIPHPCWCWMYTKCFSTLRCCGWEFGYTLMPLTHCAGRGGVFGKMGNGRACMILQCNVWGC
jgi:hypothetical protein